jgi:hypothetical protein
VQSRRALIVLPFASTHEHQEASFPMHDGAMGAQVPAGQLVVVPSQVIDVAVAEQEVVPEQLMMKYQFEQY